MSMIIADGKSRFYQWDTGQQLTVVHGEGCEEVHFCHKGDETALVCPIREAEGKRVVDVPNILLQQAGMLMAYLSEETETGSKVQHVNSFCVKPRPKPEDYIYTETEILNYTSLSNRLEKLEGEGISQAVEDYLKENPVQAGATAQEAAQIAQNTQDIAALSREKVSADALPGAVEAYLAEHPIDGNSNLLVVTFTEENGTFTPSHTYDQIKAWVNNGGHAVLTDGKVWYNLATLSGSLVRFERVVIAASESYLIQYIIPIFGAMDKLESHYNHIDVTAEVGQTIAVKSVDANGKPTEWEAVDMPTGGGGLDATIDGETLVFAESSTATIENETLIL